MKKVLALLLVMSSGLLLAQDSLKDLSLSALKFREIGPALTSGRIADLAVNPQNHDEYYVAVASGGVWKTDNHGIDFKPIFDHQDVYSIGCVQLDPQNPNVVWVGTGENNNQRSVAYGNGVYRSRDGGQSWQHMGLKNSEHIGMIKIDPNNSEIIYVAAYGPLWSAGGERGIYKSTDGGEHWDLILEVSENTGFNEIHLDPRNSEVLYATAHQRRRHVWTYVSGGPESAVYKSTDGGENWRKIEKGLPGNKGRISLAISPAQPDRIYAMVEGHGTYRSDERGERWKMTDDYNTSGNYYVELVPHPTDPDIVYSMDTYLHISTDAGANFERVPERNKHVDNHCLWINPNDPSQMIAGCDGGLYETYNGGKEWHFKPNLPVTQFYRVSVDNDLPFYNVYGGTQDNFSLGGPSQTINDRGIVNSDWFITNTGDGFETQVDPKNANIVYAQSQYGGLVRYDRKSGESVGIKPSPGKDEAAYRWNWDAPLLISPHNHKRLYFAANKVFRSDNQGNSWQTISPDLSQQIDRHKLPVMGKIQGPDAIGYDRSTTIYGNIVALDESPLQEGLLYVGTDDGLIQVSEDGGKNWRRIDQFPGVPKNTYVNQVLASLHDKNTVYALFNNHKNGDFQPYVLKSTDRGETWTNMANGLPENGAAFAMKQDHIRPDLFFLGTEFGVHFSIDAGKNWRQLKNGLPTIAIRDLEIQRRENDLVLASFGRGFFVLDDYRCLRELDEEVWEKDFHLFDIPVAHSYVEASPNGYGKAGFQGASYYMAPNPPEGASFNFYLRTVPKTKKQQRKKAEREAQKESGNLTYPPLDSLRAEAEEEAPYLLFIIRNAAGEEIRRFTEKPRKGLQRVYWDATVNSNAYLSESNAPFTKPGSAGRASPGQYAVEILLSENGVLRPLTDAPKSFELRWLGLNTFVAENQLALRNFQDSVETVRRTFYGLNKKLSNLKERQAKMKAAARNTTGVPLTLLPDLQKLEKELTALDLRMNGDDIRAKYEFETKPSLSRRISSVVWNSYYTSSAPTQEQRKNRAIVEGAIQELEVALDAVENDLDNYYRILLNNGAPYIDGDMD